eukprot:COSAG04_NODE_15681_length_523_cov_2.396226_1_plen_21_part_10
MAVTAAGKLLRLYYKTPTLTH